ncbi:MAG: 50S ribosomal protein L11 methyltransferase [Rhodovulum sulfidophilum]|uniref:Ribosomal protein L11 methyltransferase n=1 Tax=Rhodovulum sulfidophilum TaxID=35806 RepID=A0A2W5N2Y4_RHOSU|nr:MAG: 50S ribosomal protein L11 methyltransferase [Rhodovulum sulfidophilum]
MPLFYASTVLAGEDAARALGDALEALDPLSTEVRDHDDGSGLWDVGAHFDGRPDAAGLALLAALHGAPDFGVTKVVERDWVAQVRSELTPVEAGRFVVFGGHDRDRIPSNRIGLEIEAAQAFGTGHHASTQGCLTALDRLARGGLVARNVADIGGGTGVLAMAAVSVFPARAIASDIDPLATVTARENAAANGLGPEILCVTAPGFNHPMLAARAPFDLVFANILAAPLKRLAPAMARHQAPGGVAILSGLLTRQAPSVLAVYQGWGYARIDRIPIGDWTTLVLRKI